MKINIKEIAKKARVSVATISRASNPETRQKVAAKTLKRIDTLIEKYGYTPNLAAKNLRQVTTKTIGVILPYLPGIFYSSYYIHILSGIADSLLDTEYQFKMLLLKEEKRQWDQYDFESGERVDGLIITHWFKFFSRKAVLEKMNIPIVIINDFDKTVKTQFFYADHFQGGYKVAEYLHAMGHRRIAVVLGPHWSHDSRHRLEGCKAFLASVGISLAPDLIFSADYHEQTAYARAEELLKKKSRFTAIFCCNDQMAFGVIRKMEELGISCPKDISVVGYDDETRSASFRPPLTTVQVPVYDLARQGTQCLINYLRLPADSAKPLVGQTILPVALVERQSVKKITAKS